jgi:hypothetical protein
MIAFNSRANGAPLDALMGVASSAALYLAIQSCCSSINKLCPASDECFLGFENIPHLRTAHGSEWASHIV